MGGGGTDLLVSGVENGMIDFKKLINEPEPSVSINGVQIDIENTEPGTITLEQYHQVRANSPGFRLLYSKLNNEALVEAVKHNLMNCTHPFNPEVYEYALENYLVPELIKRLAVTGKALERACDEIEHLKCPAHPSTYESVCNKHFFLEQAKAGDTQDG